MNPIKRITTIAKDYHERIIVVIITWAMFVFVVGGIANSINTVTQETQKMIVFSGFIPSIILGLWCTRNFKKGDK
jgi:hypothetical protein